MIAELDASRTMISAGMRSVRHDLDIVARVEDSFRRHGIAWLSGAALIGFVLAKLPPRTKKVVIDRKSRPKAGGEKALEAGLFVTLLKFAFDVARPVLTKWLTRRVVAYAGERFTKGRTQL